MCHCHCHCLRSTARLFSTELPWLPTYSSIPPPSALSLQPSHPRKFEIPNLFTVPPRFWLCHCSLSTFSMCSLLYLLANDYFATLPFCLACFLVHIFIVIFLPAMIPICSSKAASLCKLAAHFSSCCCLFTLFTIRGATITGRFNFF